MKMKLHTVGYWGAYPNVNEATSCYYVEDEQTKILLDCGSGALSKLQNVMELQDLDAVFISHIHTDHMADIYSLEYAMLILQQLGKRKEPLDVYVYAENRSDLSFEFPHVLRVHPIHLTESVVIGSLQLTFSENVHEVPCCAMKVMNQQGHAFVYSADTGYTEKLIQFAQNVDTLLIECSFYAEQQGLVKGHLASYEVADIAKKANVATIILTHFPHYGHIQQLKEEVTSKTDQVVHLAKEGFAITI